jgi:hypothetical protein
LVTFLAALRIALRTLFLKLLAKVALHDPHIRRSLRLAAIAFGATKLNSARFNLRFLSRRRCLD